MYFSTLKGSSPMSTSIRISRSFALTNGTFMKWNLETYSSKRAEKQL